MYNVGFTNIKYIVTWYNSTDSQSRFCVDNNALKTQKDNHERNLCESITRSALS